MEVDGINVSFPVCSNVPAHIAATSTIVEEGPRICPLCNSLVRYFFINFNEKLLICENTECDFPIGYEDVQIVTVGNEVVLEEEEEVCSIQSTTCSGSPTGTLSVPDSTATWVEMEKMNRVYDSEDSSIYDVRPTKSSEKVKLQKQKRQNEEMIKKNVAELKAISSQLSDMTQQNTGECIIKENWLKKLMNLQQMSGKQLLRQEEIVKLKKREPVIGLGELKIDIDSSENKISSIMIQITNTEKDSDEDSKK